MSSSLTLGEVIGTFGAAVRARRAGGLTPAQEVVLQSLARCHTAALGGHLYRCDACGEERIAYNSCGNRHCPSCLGHKSAAWLEAREDELLPVPYFHVVFTVPEAVAALALGNKKVVYSILFRAASETLLTIAADPRHLGAQLGFLAILHTWTQTLLHHPHVHCVVPGGGLSADGERWISGRARFFLPVRVLSRLYRGKFLALLQEARTKGQLQFAGATAHLVEERSWRRWLGELRKPEWVVYAKPPFGSPELVLKYLARYTHRVAISNRRILGIDGDQVTFAYRDRADAGQRRVMRLDGAEFLRRFLLHVLPRKFVRIRYFGFLAPCCRTRKLARCRQLLSTAEKPGAADKSTTAEAEAEAEAEAATAFDATRCPACHTGRLRRIREIPPQEAFLDALRGGGYDTS